MDPNRTKSCPSLNRYFTAAPDAAATTAVEYQQLDKIMERENEENQRNIWSKLNKTQKILRLQNYAAKYARDNGVNEEKVKTFLLTSLDKGKLQRVKDVIYNKDVGEIQSIPGLCMTKTADTCHFTLRSADNRVSTLKSLGQPRARLRLPAAPLPPDST
jgi:hypothetical protein